MVNCHNAISDLTNGEIELFTTELQQTVAYYHAGDTSFSLSKKFWDEVQPALRCCGAKDWKDWENVGELKPNRKVPASCCNFDKETPGKNIKDRRIKTLTWLGLNIAILPSSKKC